MTIVAGIVFWPYRVLLVIPVIYGIVFGIAKLYVWSSSFELGDSQLITAMKTVVVAVFSLTLLGALGAIVYDIAR